MNKREIKFQFFENMKCEKPYSEALSALKCVKEKNHAGKHVFYVEWSEWI